MKILAVILALVVSYLLGSVSFAVIFSKLFSKTDVRKKGSGNAGTTNVLRVAGPIAGILTFLCDALKGALACIVGMLVFKAVYGAESEIVILYGEYACALMCMLGHAFPVYFEFKGGKCAATSVGVFAVCCPLAIIIGLIGWAISMLISRVVSLSTLVATFLVVTVSVITNGIINYGFNAVIILLTLVMGVVVVWRHKANIIRLTKGEEKKLQIKK